MGIKISQLPTISASPLGLDLRDIQPNAAIALVQSLSTQQVPISAVGGAVFVDSLSALTIRAYNFGGLTKNTLGLAAIDLQYEGNASDQVASGIYTTLVGGRRNKASGEYSTSIGGLQNVSSGFGSSVLGGASNQATNGYNTVAGGTSNVASGDRATVAGGGGNQALGTNSMVAGGYFNTVDGDNSSVTGGQYNTDNNHNNVHILGSFLSAGQANFTYVNNISSQGIITGTLSAATYVATVTSTAGTNYVLQLTDASKTIIDTASTTTTYSVPANSVTSFAIGTQIIFIQGDKNASNYTILSAGVGVTINSFNGSLSLAGDYAAGTLIKTGTDTWYLIGNLA